MAAFAESTDRDIVDYVHFGLAFYGIIIGLAGVITLSGAVALLGLIMLGVALAYFLLEV